MSQITVTGAISTVWCPQCHAAVEEPCRELPRDAVHTVRMLEGQRAWVLSDIERALRSAEDYVMLVLRGGK